MITQRRSFAEYWKYFVVCFNDVHAFGYNSAGSERIWMKFGELRVYCLELALTDFGRDTRRSESGRPCGSFVFFCQVNNARLCPFPVSPISRNLHKTWFCEVVNPFGIISWKFALKGSFLQRTVIIVNDFRLQAAISRKWLQILENHHRMARLWNVGFPSVPVESTQTHLPSQQAAYEKGLFDFLDTGGSSVWCCRRNVAVIRVVAPTS